MPIVLAAIPAIEALGAAAAWGYRIYRGYKIVQGAKRLEEMARGGNAVLSEAKPEECTGHCPASEQADDKDKAQDKSDKKPPFKGKPNSTVRGPDNSRSDGDDGYPATDRDTGHADESGIGSGDHSHDWGRPSQGGPPSHLDRGPPRLPKPDDPPIPWR